MFNLILIIGAFMVLGSAQKIKPCKVNDSNCINEAAKEMLPILISGIPSLGLEPTDPLFIEEIDGNLSILKFRLTNATITGSKNCKMDNVKLNLKASSLHFEVVCLNGSMSGHYNISGRLIILPVEGDGEFTIEYKKYIMGFDSEIKIAKGKGDKEHLQIKKFKLKLQAEDGLICDFKNLFNGNEELASAVLKFANENWKEVADFVQEPIWIAFFQKQVRQVNKYLKTIPMNQFLIQ